MVTRSSSAAEIGTIAVSSPANFREAFSPTFLPATHFKLKGQATAFKLRPPPPRSHLSKPKSPSMELEVPTAMRDIINDSERGLVEQVVGRTKKKKWRRGREGGCCVCCESKQWPLVGGAFHVFPTSLNFACSMKKKFRNYLNLIKWLVLK